MTTQVDQNREDEGQLAHQATPKAVGHEADNRCVICGEVRENMKPLAILENDPEAVGGVCNELYEGYSEFYPDHVPCYMIWHRRAAEEAMKRERSKCPAGRPPTEIEKLTDAVKELTQELATWRPKTRRTK